MKQNLESVVDISNIPKEQQKGVLSAMLLIPFDVKDKLYSFHLKGHNLTAQQYHAGKIAIYNGTPCPLYVFRN